MQIKILIIGDIVGKPGRKILQDKLPRLIERWSLSFVIANGENAAGGSGITLETMEEILKAGVDCITSGDHVWKKKEVVSLLEKDRRLLRPENYGERAAGSGVGLYKTRTGHEIGVVNLLGRVFMKPCDCPFKAAERAVSSLSHKTKIILVDMHAEATSEKVAMGWMLDGRVSAVFGTHTHIQTADERVLPKGTAYITDLGMTGPYESVLGRQTDRVLQAILTQMPCAFDVAKGDVRLCGALVTVDSDTGRALDIQRLVVKEMGENG
jgi:metallophosphoesterase (TIGR00282 family)